MASQRARFIAVLALAICTGCGTTLGLREAGSRGDAQPRTVLADPSIYSPAAPRLRSLAAHFVRAVAEYDTPSEARREFLGRLNQLATASEQRRLHDSPRSRLRWQILRQRGERTHLTLAGVSEIQDIGGDRLIIVECVMTTTTNFARAQTFNEFWLAPVRTPEGWRIDRATGPGL